MKTLLIYWTVWFLAFELQLEGSWKLSDFSGFDTMIISDMFNRLSEDEKLDAIQGMEYVLENTIYTFKGDSIFFTNAGPNFTKAEKEGKFLLKSDTLFVFESGKVNAIQFFISSFTENEMKMKFVHEDGELGPTIMTFTKIDQDDSKPADFFEPVELGIIFLATFLR